MSEEPEIISEAKYKKLFGMTDSAPDFPSEIHKDALKHALEIRKFEIEMYWKRATYFWTLIASAFVAYFAILGASAIPEKNFLAYIVSCVGFFFTYAWLRVNQGSKYWQENWENHVTMLEDRIIGPLFKTILKRKFPENGFEKFVTGPSSFSVSKINLIVNLFTLVIWVALALVALWPIGWAYPLSYLRLVVAAITAVFVFFLHHQGKTFTDKHTHEASLRKSAISPE